VAKAAGIDAFLVSWWGKVDDRDRNFERAVLPAAEDQDFKLALLDELAQFHDDTERYATGLAKTLETYAHRPAYLKIDGRPVVTLYQSVPNPGLDPAAFLAVKRRVEADVGPVYWIVDKLEHAAEAAREFGPARAKRIPPEWLEVPGIDSFAFYSTFSHFRAHEYGKLIGKYRWLVESAHRAGRKMILPVHPGHDNSRFSKEPYRMPRRDGETLRDFLRAAEDAGTDGILVTSFNEWPETTVIEPAEGWPDPWLYARILAEWKGIPFREPEAPPVPPSSASPNPAARP
jgi:hypothetical protein